jgi:uroporphyrinogen decarboxylase
MPPQSSAQQHESIIIDSIILEIRKVDMAIHSLPPEGAGDGAMLAVLRGERCDPPPLWLMRQAGRYLPEYRALRADKGGFLELCMDSAAAAEVTLQPIHRFGFDAAILFSDILIVPYAMGQDLWFEAGEGPRLAPRLAEAALDTLMAAPARFAPIYETVRRVRAALDPGRALLGFAGSPWTVATYMVDGQGSKDHGAARRLAYGDPARFGALIDAIVETTIGYLIGQIDAGVDAVQLFDSWAGSLAPDEFVRWVIAPNRAIVDGVRSARPGVPIIGFPKGAGAKLAAYARDVAPDVIGLDETVDPEWADSVLPAGMPVQGNLDPLRLIAGGGGLEAAVLRIRSALAGRPHIFNLGHGILPDTPIAHVAALVAAVRRPLP